MTDNTNSHTETSRDLERSDAVLDLVSGWYIAYEELHDALAGVLKDHKWLATNLTRGTVEVDLAAWLALTELWSRNRPTPPIWPVKPA